MVAVITRDGKQHVVAVEEQQPPQFYRWLATCSCGWQTRGNALQYIQREVEVHKMNRTNDPTPEA